MQPFWNSEVQKFATKLWLPSQGTNETVFQGWGSSSLQVQTQVRHGLTLAPKTISWSKARPAGKAQKIQLYPTPEQKLKLDQAFGTVRWTYNQCLAAYTKGTTNPKELRDKFLNKDTLAPEFSWALAIPYDLRHEALRDLLQAIKVATKTQKSKKGRKPKFKFRSKKNDQTLLIHHKHWAQRTFYPTWFGKVPIRATQPLPERLNYDTRLQRTRLGEYYLCLLRPLSFRTESQGSEPRVIALDPGDRAFLTGYDPSGKILEIGKGDKQRILSLYRRIDKLKSRCTKVTHRKRYKLNRAILRYNRKIRERVQDLQRKTCKWLCEHYDLVVLPKFPTSQLVRKKTRKIGKVTARTLLTWSHYQFRTRLVNKAREYPTQVVLGTEEYTSKTCGKCGYLHQTLGSAEVFSCPQCHLVIGRDVNGARNILLLYLKKTDSIIRSS
jgi:putative transposase